MAVFNFGKQLENLLHDKKITTKEFAESIGVNEETARIYIYGGCVPSEKIGAKIAKILGVPYTLLMTGKEDEERSFDVIYPWVRDHCEHWTDEQKNKMIRRLLKGAKIRYIWE